MEKIYLCLFCILTILSILIFHENYNLLIYFVGWDFWSQLSLFLRLPFGLMDEYVKISRKTSENGFMSNKCNQYDYSSSEESYYRRHPKMNSGVKLEKCNQCNYAFSQAVHLRRHLKTHSGEKSSKCNQCHFACSDPSSLWRHMKRHRSVSKGETAQGK